MSLKKYFVVIGAGPMGLMTAMELLKAGHEVDIFERDDRIGGMSATFDFDGLEIERYYHFICKTDYALFDLLKELGLESTLRWVDTRMGYYHGGRLQDWGNPVALLKFRGLGLIGKFRYGLHAMWAKSIRDWHPYDKLNATRWIRKWVGRRAYDVLWKSLFELKLFEYSENISAAWIGTRIQRVAKSRRNLMHESMGYLSGGSATLLRAMEKFITDRGGRIHLTAGVDKVCVQGDKVSGVLYDGKKEMACDGVISTAPIQYVPRFVPDLPEAFAKHIRTIENIPVACVILKMREPFSPNFWTNINDPGISIPGLIEYSNLNGESGHSILYAPFYMPKTHDKWRNSNEQLIQEVIGYLHKIRPDFTDDVILATHCHRYEFAQTICPPGFFDMLPPMNTPLEGFYMADTAYYYPEDRSINESVLLASKLANSVHSRN